jgi:sigma-E factor negative regulatory protein RseC
MSEETQDVGIVTAIEDGVVTVSLQRGGGCKSCSMHGFCFSKSSPSVFKLQSKLPLSPGDRVELEVSPSGRVLASFLLFVVPVIFMLLGFMLADIWFSEFISIMFAFGAMALSFFIIRYCDKKWGNRLKVEIGRKL